VRKTVAAIGVLASLAAMGAVASASVHTEKPAATELRSTTSSRVVHLLTGDTVLLRTVSGRTQLGVVPVETTGPAPAIGQLKINGRDYVFPGVVRRYLGTFIDPELFDVTRLAAAGSDKRTPVRIQYAADTNPNVPGVTIVHKQGHDATGYVSVANAHAFEQALLTQWRADVRAGASSPKSLLGGVTHIGLDAPGPPPTAQPHYPMRTLVIKALDASGRPANGVFVDVVNTDALGKFVSLLVVNGGEERISVPLGHYSLFAVGDLPDPTPDAANQFIVPISDFAVTTNMQTIVVDARTATITPSVRTPRPAGLSSLSLGWSRYGGDKQLSISVSWVFGTDQEVRVAPAPVTVVGRTDWETYWQLAGAPTSGRPYAYSLSFRDPHRVPVDQRYVVTESELARVNAAYYGNGSDVMPLHVSIPYYPTADTPGFVDILPVGYATRRTEYLLGAPGAVWFDELISASTATNPGGGSFFDGGRRYLAGSVRTVDWLRAPAVPGFTGQTNGEPVFGCTTCRTASKLMVSLSQVTDADPGHDGLLDPSVDGSPISRFRLYENGKLVDDENDVNDGAGGTFDVPTTSTTYRIVDQAIRPWAGYSTTESTTDLSFKSAAGQGGRLPKGWDCRNVDTGACTVLPIMRVRMPLPTDLAGILPLGKSTASLTVEHIQGAPKSAITAEGVQTSVDHGTTWHQATTTRLGNGRFRVVLDNPGSAANQPLSLRITAKDAAGGRITETVLNACRIANG